MLKIMLETLEEKIFMKGKIEKNVLSWPTGFTSLATGVEVIT